MPVSRVKLISVRETWHNGEHFDHSWPTWNFLLIGDVLVIGDLDDHSLLLQLGGTPQNGAPSCVNVGGSFRIGRDGTVKDLGWTSPVIDAETPPALRPLLVLHIQRAVDMHALPPDPRHTLWDPPR